MKFSVFVTKAHTIDDSFDENEVDFLDNYEDYPIGDHRAAPVVINPNAPLEASKLILLKYNLKIKQLNLKIDNQNSKFRNQPLNWEPNIKINFLPSRLPQTHSNTHKPSRQDTNICLRIRWHSKYSSTPMVQLETSNINLCLWIHWKHGESNNSVNFGCLHKTRWIQHPCGWLVGIQWNCSDGL